MHKRYDTSIRSFTYFYTMLIDTLRGNEMGTVIQKKQKTTKKQMSFIYYPIKAVKTIERFNAISYFN